jgi:hypothetical protein
MRQVSPSKFSTLSVKQLETLINSCTAKRYKPLIDHYIQRVIGDRTDELEQMVHAARYDANCVRKSMGSWKAHYERVKQQLEKFEWTVQGQLKRVEEQAYKAARKECHEMISTLDYENMILRLERLGMKRKLRAIYDAMPKAYRKFF